MNQGTNGSRQSVIARLLSLGFSRRQALAAGTSSPSIQKEAYLRSLLKEVKKSRNPDRPLENVDFIVLDTETTGFRPEHGDEIISIAAGKVCGHRLDGYFFTHVRPSVNIPDSISELTGITEQDVKKAPTLKMILPQLIDFIGNGVIIGYHIGHDMAFLNSYMQKTFGVRFTHPVLEIQQVLIGLDFIHSSVPLDEALKLFDIQMHSRHTALGDVKMIEALWEELLKKCRENNILTLRELYVLLSGV